MSPFMHRGGLLKVAAAVFLLGASACAPAAPGTPPTAVMAAAPPAAPKPTLQPIQAPSPAAATVAPAQPAVAASVAPQPASPSASSVPAAYDAKAVADFYTGKSIRMVVGSAPGGGYDTYSRAISSHLGQFIPGNPTLIVDNLPGAGGLTAAIQLYNAGPKDGTAIGNVSATIVQQQLLRPEGLQYDASKFELLDMPSGDNVLCVVTKKSGVKSIEETMGPNGKQLIIGIVPSLSDEATILREALGANLKIVSGYAGTSQLRLAMDSGEIDGQCLWSWESIQVTALDRVQNGDYVIISQNTGDTRNPVLPAGVPVAYELAKTDEARQLIHYGITLPRFYQRLYILPPGVPADRVAAIREAFSKTLADKGFLADAAKSKLAVMPIPGAQVQQQVQAILNTPAPIRAKLSAMIGQ